MKQQMLVTTALVAATALGFSSAALAQAKKPSMSLGGYFETAIGAALNHDDGPNDTAAVDVHNETEIYVNGNATLDNGISLLVRWEIEGDGDGSPAPGGFDPIDEAYMIVRGSFGQIVLGSEDNAAVQMTTGYSGSWPTAVGQNLAFDAPEWTINPGLEAHGARAGAFFNTARDSRPRGSDNDSEKVTYYTPRFAGFQLGVSYIPNAVQQSTTNGTEDAGAPADADTTLHDGFAVAMNYTGKFDQVSYGIAAGYVDLQEPEDGGKGERIWNIATRWDFGPLRAAIGFKRTAETNGTGPALVGRAGSTDYRGRIIDTGISYTMGPNAFSVVYSNGEIQSTDAKFQSAMGSYRRTLGPGVFWNANLIWVDADMGTTPGSVGLSSDSLAVSTALRVNF